ncbi:MAG: orc1/cdc6 family replication initiation protein [Nanoarchaeota archaeon]|nr:orc1/cdc6 family replication initiation protein [Nanoarchaeota archaeon]MBU1051750.1 orc1/cdc6 family replication initiation protein [Nanoarchaeota archaeon]MBU1988475.1 orc1/cdc6 family replication initiation protein [Nanoarchaeota archaeon]
MDKLDKIFDSYVSSSLFKNKSVLQSNYSPETILHRGDQVENIASILGPTLTGERASNLFLFGKTGSGKTLSAKYVGDKLEAKTKASEKTNLKFLYINCKSKKVSDTEYRIIAELISLLGGSVPATGLPTDTVYSRFIDMIDSKKQVVVLVLDEIDQAVKKISDGFIYTLTRINSELKNAQISIIGISNSLTFMDHLDPRVRSSLGEEEIVFPPYNALQLRDILTERSKEAFSKGVLEEGVIAKCAAYAAREHGDARRALDLLRVAGEVAVREGSKKVTVNHIDTANQKIERDKMLDIIESEPTQFQIVLQAVMRLTERRETRRKKSREMVDDRIFTGDVYNKYQEICEETKNEILTQRRVGDIIGEFDMLGIINARVISKGRQGRTREIKLMLSPNIKEKAGEILKKALGI